MNLSVITPTKNSIKYILDNLESVHLRQCVDIEQIIIDGNSTDKTLALVEEFKSQHGANIKIVESNDDAGMYHAINKGMLLISGDIWSELNSDDVYYPKISNVLSEFNDDSVDVVYGNVDMVDAMNMFIHTLYLPKFNLEYLILKGYCLTILQPAMFLRKSVIDKVGYFDTDYKYASDYDYCIRLAGLCNLKKLPYSLTRYRMHEESITWGSSERRAQQTLETKSISEKHRIKNDIFNHSILKDDARLYFNQLHFNNLPYIFKRLNEIIAHSFDKKE